MPDTAPTNNGTDNTVIQTGDGVVNAPSFLETLPKEYQGHEALKDVKDAGSLAKLYVETLGKAPKVPGSPKDYVLEIPDQAKGLKDIDVMREAGHKAGLTQEQMASVFKPLMDSFVRQRQAEESAVKQNEAAIKAKWPGEALAANTTKAERAMMAVGGPDLLAAFRESGLIKSPSVLVGFLKVYEAISEAALHTGSGPSNQTGNVGVYGTRILSFPSMQGNQ